MKKLLIILMVVAMASFLFVGCNGVTPPVDPVEPDEPVLPTTVAPIITSVPDIVGGYINKANAADGIVVNGTAPTYSEVKVYISGLTAGTGDSGFNGVFSVVVAKADLIKAVKTDGAKVLYATATEAGLTESASSNKLKFTLDTAKPTIDKCSAKAGTPAVGGTAVATPASAGTCVVPASLIVNPANIVPGTWTVKIVTQIGPWVYQVEITDSNGVPTTYSWIPNGYTFPANAPIPGVSFQLKPAPVTGMVAFDDNTPFPDTITGPAMSFVGVFWPGDVIIVTGSGSNDGTYTIATVATVGPDDVITLIPTDTLANEGPGPPVTIQLTSLLTVGQQSQIVCTAVAPAVPGYIDVTFNEPVTGASILAGTWTAYAATVNLMPTPTVMSSTVARLTEAVAGTMLVGQAYSVSCNGPTDLAGNSIPASSPETCTGIVMP